MRRNTECNDKDAEIAKRGRGITRGDLGVSFGRRSQSIAARLISDECRHQQLRMAATTYAFALRENSSCARCSCKRDVTPAIWRDFFRLNASAPCKRASFDAGIFDGSSHELGFDFERRAREREFWLMGTHLWPLRTPRPPTGKTASASRLRIRTRHGQHHLRAPDCG